MDDDVLFCINGTEHRVKRDSEAVKDTLNDYIRRRTSYKARSKPLPSHGYVITCLHLLRAFHAWTLNVIHKSSSSLYADWAWMTALSCCLRS